MLVGVSLTVHLPEELARRVTEAAQARHVDPEQVAIEAIEAQLPVRTDHDALEAFIGSGSSGRREPFDITRRVPTSPSANWPRAPERRSGYRSPPA